jgi:hypothetical protein
MGHNLLEKAIVSQLVKKIHRILRNRNVHYLFTKGPVFKSQSRRRAMLIEVFVVFLSPSGRIPAYCLKLDHELFVPNSFPFIVIHLSPYHRHYALELLTKRP